MYIVSPAAEVAGFLWPPDGVLKRHLRRFAKYLFACHCKLVV